MRSATHLLLRILLAAGVAGVGVSMTCANAAPAEGYSIVKKIPLPGEGSWDYLTVDEGAPRLNVTHATQVQVIDIDSGSVVGTIPNKLGVHGVALATDLGKGFLSDGKVEKVTIFDLKTLKPIADAAAGQKTDAIIFDSATGRVFAFNGESNSATVIDEATGKVAGTVDLGGGPEYAAADGQGFVYDNLEEENLVLKIDARKLTVDQRWPTVPAAHRAAWPSTVPTGDYSLVAAAR